MLECKWVLSQVHPVPVSLVSTGRVKKRSGTGQHRKYSDPLPSAADAACATLRRVTAGLAVLANRGLQLLAAVSAVIVAVMFLVERQGSRHPAPSRVSGSPVRFHSASINVSVNDHGFRNALHRLLLMI